MNCPTCNNVNPPDARFCASCGVRVVQHTGDHQASPAPHVQPNTPTAPFDDGTVRYPATAPGPSQPPFESAPLLAQGRSSSILPVLVTVAVVAAIVVMGAVLVLSGGDDSVASVTTDQTTVATSEAPTPTLPTTTTTLATTTTPAPETTAAPTTAAPTTAAPATVAPTTAPPAPPTTNPAALPALPAEPGPINAPGGPQVLAIVSPSGLPFDQVATAFGFAQDFGDALALEDWDRARFLSPELAGQPDDFFGEGYANTNRISLMLADARPNGTEFELLLVSVAVELGGEQTSLYCLQWNVDSVSGFLRQLGGSRLTTWQANAQPEAIRNDPAAMATVNQCVWP